MQTRSKYRCNRTNLPCLYPRSGCKRVLKKYLLNVIVGKRHVLKTYLHNTHKLYTCFFLRSGKNESSTKRLEVWDLGCSCADRRDTSSMRLTGMCVFIKSSNSAFRVLLTNSRWQHILPFKSPLRGAFLLYVIISSTSSSKITYTICVFHFRWIPGN